MGKVVRWGLAAGVAAAYAFYEPFRYRLVTHEVPVDWDGPPLDLLHVSDTHLSPRDGRLLSFLEELPGSLPRTPDLVLATGDFIQGDEAIGPAVAALGGLQARSGRFYVFGSHDYYVSSGASYTKYFSGNTTLRQARRTDSQRLDRDLQNAGWIPLTNRSETLEVQGHPVTLAGVDDPYLKRHDLSHLTARTEGTLGIALVHAPDVVSEWALEGFHLILAGHTHGGQVRIPGIGAVVTNCSLPTGLAAGLNRVGHTWLHVSPGLGTGRYSPVRFLVPPQATLLRLVPTRTR